MVSRVDGSLLVHRHPPDPALRLAAAEQAEIPSSESDRTSADHRTMTMRDFFKGWRRKLGVVTLLMVCLFTCGWIRSLSLSETLHFPARKHMTNLRHHEITVN